MEKSIPQENKMDSDLAEALAESKEYARRGYKLTEEAISLLTHTVDSVSEKLQENIKGLGQSNVNDLDLRKDLSKQLSLIRRNYQGIPYQLNAEIKSVSKDTFSITLFGRTMAGKSTLMEILTHGSGTSIGKGAQRTTRDVRNYSYNGMRITDVPGIAAFDGQEDEDVAFEAAKKSDLVIFLLTDDAPQAEEARCLNEILSLGKPVLCLVNVKVNIDSETNLKLFERDIQKKMNPKRLFSIKNQFLEFGSQYGQNWNKLSFVNVHLKSTHLSQQTESEMLKSKLYELSQFSKVENLIRDEVVKNGKFYKLKTYSDNGIVYLIDAFETLFEQSARNSEKGSILISKRKQLKEWSEVFESDAKLRIESFLFSISHELRKEVTTFAENHYNDSEAANKWKEIMKNQKIETLAKDLLEELSMECKEELEAISNEIEAEVNLSDTIFHDKSINMPSTINGKRAWQWGTNLLSAGLIISSLIWVPTLGIAGVVVALLGGLGSFLFGDAEKKALDARRKLEKKLNANIDNMLDGLKKDMLDFLYKDLLKKQIYSTLKGIDRVVDAVFTLSEIQQDLAKALNAKLSEMNRTLITEALSYTGFEGLEWHITKIVRIPGYAMMIELEDGKRFPNEAKKALSNLLKEKVWFVFNTNNLNSILKQAIGKGSSRPQVRIQYINKQPRIVHIPNLDFLEASTIYRVRLAQQLTELLIMK